jgi:type IV pilus assembly protein PilM
MFGLFEKDKLDGFGLDISEASIKVMQLSATSKGPVARAYGRDKLPPQIIANHSIVNPEKLSSHIKKIVDAAKIDSKFVVVSIPEAKSFVRQIKLPKMELDQIQTAVPFEFEQNIPIPIDQVYFDWQIVTESSDGFELLVTASPKDYIDSLIEVLAAIKLQALAFELESQATARALLGPDNLNQANLIIDISELQTSFLLVEKNNLQYTSSVPIGGASFTESIARNLSIKPDEAETAKREQGLVADSKKRNIRQAILPILDNIVDEIRNVIRFYDEHYKSHLPLNQIIVCGGGAKLLGLTDYVAARLNLSSAHPTSNVTLGDSLKQLAKNPINSKIDGLSYSTAIGLAMRAIGFKMDW